MASQAQQQAQAVANYHGILDDMDTERYGKSTTKMTPTQVKNRDVLRNAVYEWAVRKQSRGESIPDLKAIVVREDRAEFFNDILKEQEKKRAQSPRAKMGNPTRGTKPAVESLEEWDAKGKKWSEHPTLAHEVEKRMRRTE
jgi:hypothetical protein